MTRAIHEKDLKLFEICEITKEYPILVDTINKYPKIHKEELKSISSEHKRFFDNIYSRVKLEALKEWTGSLEKDIKKFKKEDNKKCYICNHPIEYVCIIHNKFNKKSIEIGRECNKHFHIYSEADIDRILAGQKQLSKMNRIDKEFPNLLKNIQAWKEIIDNESIYIFNSIKSTYIDTKEQLSELYKEYTQKNINHIREEEILGEIDFLLKKGLEERNKIQSYIRKNKNSILCPTKMMVNSIRSNPLDKQGIKWLEEDGKITSRVLYRFRDEEFCKRLINRFNAIIESKGILIENFKRYNGIFGYSIVLDTNKECRLFCSYEYLCLHCGDLIVGNEQKSEDFSIDEIIENSSLIDEYSIEYGLEIIESFLQYRFIELEQYFHEYGDVLWKVKKDASSNKSKFFYQVKVKDLEVLLKELIYRNDRYKPSMVFDELTKRSKTIGNSDAYDLIKRRNR